MHILEFCAWVPWTKALQPWLSLSSIFQCGVNLRLFKGLLSGFMYFFEKLSPTFCDTTTLKGSILLLHCPYAPSTSYSQSLCSLYPPSETIILITCPRKANFTFLKKIICDACPLGGDNTKKKPEALSLSKSFRMQLNLQQKSKVVYDKLVCKTFSFFILYLVSL